MLHITFQNETLILHAEKALYWSARRTLLIADLHLGKAAHFRKEGIPVPRQLQSRNFARLEKLLAEFAPERVLFLGDLFHSVHNESWAAFAKFLRGFPDVSFELVLGNHDILTDSHYAEAGLTLHAEPYFMPPFILSHHPQDELIEGFYNLHGHIHPCVYLEGRGRQYLRLPCFHFGRYHGILPAFGEFTGMARTETYTGDRVFVVAENTVTEVTD